MSFVVKESYRQSDKEFRGQILKIRSANITHLLIIGYGFLYPNIFQELKDQKLLGQIQIIGGWGFLYPNLTAADLEGVIVVGPRYVFTKSSNIQDFYAKFKQRFGYEANFDAAMTYAAIEVTAMGIERAGTINIDRINTSLRSLKNVPTILGSVTVNEDGAISFPIGIGHFSDGRVQSIR
jgi:ABC-type branched-subunit amino acid transport system substrate-binding protein